MALLNGDLDNEVYMKQHEGFNDDSHKACRLSIYGLEQAFRQWYLKFHKVITSFGFSENLVDQYIYLKIFDMDCRQSPAPLVKVKSLMYAQAYTRPDICLAVGLLEHYESNPGIQHWVVAKKVMRTHHIIRGTNRFEQFVRDTEVQILLLKDPRRINGRVRYFSISNINSLPTLGASLNYVGKEKLDVKSDLGRGIFPARSHNIPKTI
ncbi:hypothetical protein CRG98_020657 [Punica granatum]|uniref:Reverse transcriptase Ty1/copia-type domain-containing protein n=1 Tax=Punica granatum TaxID=22663 RepID=A0A2I0JRQ0_PUNGR|nr:hypothetical protein CRG98_020657 [Punica granatum]